MPRSPRTLRVLVGTLPVEDGLTPPPVVGEVGHYRLLFVEAGDDGPDATIVTVQARAEPVGDGSPSRGGLMWDGTVRDEPPSWSIMLHGNGWTASWSAPRPVVGQVVLRGTVVGDLSGGQVRGRVTRARVVSETFDLTDPDHPRIPALQRLRDVDTGPRWFDHGLVAPADAPRTGWFSPVPGDPYVAETGVLVDLDLDDVPPLPLRPAIVPGALSVHDRDVWVVDARLPPAARLTPAGALRVGWPGRILGAPEAPGRQVHADAHGCWITGPDGVRRCDVDASSGAAEVRTVLEEPVGPAARSAGRPSPTFPTRPAGGRSSSRPGPGRRGGAGCSPSSIRRTWLRCAARTCPRSRPPCPWTGSGCWRPACGVGSRADRADPSWWTSPT